MFFKLLTITIAIISNIACFATDFTSQEIMERAQKAAAISTTMPQSVKQSITRKSAVSNYNATELDAIISTLLKEGFPAEAAEDLEFLQKAQISITEKLRSFKITGIAYAVHKNLACIWGGLYPTINATYKNIDGETKKASFKLNMPTIGLQLAAGAQIDLIFFTDVNAFNFYETKNKTITMGRGVRLDLNLPYPRLNARHYTPNELAQLKNTFNQLKLPFNKEKFATELLAQRPFFASMTYAPFTNINGGMIILSIGIDALNILLASSYNPFKGISLVRNGATLTPIQ